MVPALGGDVALQHPLGLEAEASPRLEPAVVTGSAPWVISADPRPDAGHRLFCVPHAGAGPSVFREWPASVPPSIEVCAVHLPGREGRLLEPPCAALTALVEQLDHAIRPWLDRPFALFGHSMGALIAFELARRLRVRGDQAPTRLFVSAHRAPELPARGPRLHRLSDAELMLTLRHLHGTPAEVLANVELMRLLLPTLRADCTLCETYEYAPGERLACSIVALGGSSDPGVAVSELEAWRGHTRGSFELRLFPGDHFYLHAGRAALLDFIITRLAREGPARTPRARNRSR
jgi:medium-chain acyl-[acyl-carrier-protein] hydrolase